MVRVVLALIISLLASAPIQKEQEFHVPSWKTGEQQILEQKLILSLEDNQTNYGAYINDSSGIPRYKLVARPLRFSDRVRFEAWQINLYKEPDPLVPLDKYPNDNLLSYQRPGPGGDYFPVEDNISLLYPSEKPNVLNGDVGAVYPMSAKRVIKVEGFYCVIQVLNYKFSSTNPRRLESLIVQVEFTNIYESFRKGAA